MKLSGLLFAAALCLSALVGCSGGDGEIALDAATTPLTAQGNDKLFTVRIVEAREGGYSLEGLVVKVILEDKDPMTVSCATQDANSNGTLDKDDKLDCNEPQDNRLGTDLAGKEIDVELYAKIDGEETKVGGATWTPAK